MSRHSTRLAQALLSAVTVVGLSACGASLDAQTYQERNQAGSTDTSVGGLAIRNVVIAPPAGEVYEEGGDAEATLTVTNATEDEDRLVEATSDAAEEVVVLVEGEEDELVVPPLGSADGAVLELRGLTRELRAGEYVSVVLRFEGAGAVEMLVPVALTGVSDRPIYTGEYEEGGEEPALQGPAGGHELGGDAEAEGE